MEPKLAALSSETALLDPPEWCFCIRNEAAVECNHAALEPVAHSQASPQIACVYIANKAIFRVVGASNHLVFVIKGKNGRDRPEDLFGKKRRAGLDIGQNR